AAPRQDEGARHRAHLQGVPSATVRSRARSSPPSGPAAVETRWTAAGPVWRSVSGGAERSREITVPPAGPAPPGEGRGAGVVATAARARMSGVFVTPGLDLGRHPGGHLGDRGVLPDRGEQDRPAGSY